MQYYAGLDLGGTFVKGGIVDDKGNIVAKDKIPTGKDRPYTEIARDMAALVKSLAKKAGVAESDLKAVGIGSPGTIDSKNGVIVYSNNIRWENVPLASEIEKELSLPVSVTNDANAAALGESFAGAAKKYRGKIEGAVRSYCLDTLERFDHPDLSLAFLTYTTANEEMLSVARNILKERGFKKIYETRAGGTITSHCGEHCLGILYINDGGAK